MTPILLILLSLGLVSAKSISYKGITEEDQPIYALETPYSYALDRLNQRQLPLDNVYYSGKYSGKGITVYIVDTGISENVYYNFTCGHNFIGRPHDCSTSHIHGTHVGSLVGSKAFGTAPGSTIVSLKVLNDFGAGSLSTVIDALDYLLARNVTCSVVNMSIGGGYSRILNMKVQEMVDAGNRVIVAAGNFGRDACLFSPGSAPAAVTVGSVDITDNKSSFSNYGSCVDIHAPGRDVIGATGGSHMMPLSGTSMSTPLISGIAALHMEHKGCDAHLRRSKIRRKRKFKIGFMGK